jgi:phosphatidylglycerol---prolipoprotein diacylglyceryl transferase
MIFDPAYAMIMSLAIVAGALVARRDQAALPLNGIERGGILAGALIGSLVGARLPFVLWDWELFLTGEAWFLGGKTILAGFVGGYVGVEAMKWALEIHVRTGDTFAVSVPTAVGIGRLACLRAGCCHGMPTTLPWGIVFPAVDNVPRHPTQIYELIFHLSCAISLAFLRRHGVLKGNLIKLYFILYGSYRFLSEFLRPEPPILVGLTAYQLFCICIVSVFSIMLYVDLWVQRHARRQTV